MEVTPTPPFQVGLQETRDFADPETWRERFAAQRVLALPQILAPDLRDMLLERAARSSYIQDGSLRIGARQIERPQIVGRVLSLALNARPLLEWLEGVTGCRPLRAVAGHLVQHHPTSSAALDWHDDLNDDARKLAIVINLSDAPFAGGQFQLRRKGEQALMLAFDHTEPGSALLFAVHPDLEHRVLPVTGKSPRRVFAGWFLDRPDPGGLSSA